LDVTQCVRRSQTAATEERRIRRLNFVDAQFKALRLGFIMKSSTFRVVPLKTEVAEAARRKGAAGVQDHVVITVDSPQAFPCRHCLRWAELGERVVLFPYAAIPPGHAYSESGPIVVHAEACERYEPINEYPSEFCSGRVFRAYNSHNRIIDAKVVNGTAPEAVIENLFENPETTFVHIRSLTHGCYTFAIDRA
jgi:hypothetical protein